MDLPCGAAHGREESGENVGVGKGDAKGIVNPVPDGTVVVLGDATFKGFQEEGAFFDDEGPGELLGLSHKTNVAIGSWMVKIFVLSLGGESNPPISYLPSRCFTAKLPRQRCATTRTICH